MHFYCRFNRAGDNITHPYLGCNLIYQCRGCILPVPGISLAAPDVIQAYNLINIHLVCKLSHLANSFPSQPFLRAYPSLHPSGVVHWVPEQLNIKAVTGACKLIDGCSLALCSATVSVVSAGICHRNKVNSIAWLYRKAQPKDSIIYITLHYIKYIPYILVT